MSCDEKEFGEDAVVKVAHLALLLQKWGEYAGNCEWAARMDMVAHENSLGQDRGAKFAFTKHDERAAQARRCAEELREVIEEGSEDE